MKNNYIFYCIFLLLITKVSAQNQVTTNFVPSPKYSILFRTVPVIKESDPNWVRLLYSSEPNYYEINEAFAKYYATNVFEKTIHTQNLKFFNKIVNQQDYLQEDGTIYIPNVTEKNQKRAQLIQSRLEGNTINAANIWTPVGPFKTLNNGGLTQKSSQVNVYTVDQSISNPNVLYLGTETGAVYKTTNKGLQWNAVGDDLFNDGGIGVVKVDPTNEDIVYVGVGNRLLKSVDGGANWIELLNSNQLQLSTMTIHSTNPNILLVGGNTGLRRSTDGGTSWATIYTDRCWDLQLKTDDPNTVFLAKRNVSKNITEILKSTDAGLTFTVKDSGWFAPIGGVAQSDGGARIGVTDADANRVYVILLGEENDAVDDNNYIGIYRSNDAAESWSTPYDGNNDGNPDNEPGGPYSDDHWCFTHFGVTTTGYNQGYYDLAIDVSDTNPDNFLVGSLNLFKSEDGGVTYTRWGGYGCTGCSPGYRHPDIQAIEINGSDVWVTSDGGIDYYDANLDFQESRNNGINGSDYWGFDQGWNHDVMVGGRYHNGNAAYYQTYGIGNFLSLGGAEAATGYVNKGENRKVYHSDISGKEIPEVITDPILNIPKYTLFPNEHYWFSRRSEITNDPRYWNTLYLGKDNKLWKSDNEGLSFDLVKEFGTEATDFVKAIEVSRIDPNIIFVTQKVGSTGKLWKSIDGGANWTDVTIPANHQTMYLSLNANHELYLALNNGYSNTNKVFKSSDLGVSWTNLTTAVLNGEWIENIQVQEGTDGGVYLTSNKSIWYRNNTHTDWQPFSNGLPVNFRITKILPFYRDGVIRVSGTRGMWERDLFEVSDPVAQPMVALKTVNCHRETVQFEDFSVLNHTGATWLWQFPGATTVSSNTVRNPIVTYSNPGAYDVTLTVTDGNGKTDTKTVQQMVTVESSLCYPEPNPMQALSLSSNGEYATNSNVNVSNVSNFTCTAWVKPNGIQPDYSAIFSLSSGDGVEKNVLNFREGNNTLGIHWNGGYWGWDSNLIVSADEWSFVAITVTPTTIKLYVNNESVTWNINSAPFDLTRIILGSYYEWDSRNYKGLLEEITFWDRALTDEEIKLSRHLTKSDLTDANLLAYYQFNHENSGKIYDKKTGYDLLVSGGANLVSSDAPIGPGTSELIQITSGGIKDFANANLTMTFPNTGTYPDGDIVVTNLTIDPSLLPTTNTIDTKYWIVNNYGVNSTFSNLTDIVFKDVANIDQAQASDVFLYKRNSNADISINWNQLTNPASSINTSELSATFSGAGDFSSFSQFYLGSDVLLDVEEPTSETTLVLYPNPVSNGQYLFFENNNEEINITLYTIDGKQVLKEVVRFDEKILIDNLSTGMYLYVLETKKKLFSGKLLIK